MTSIVILLTSLTLFAFALYLFVMAVRISNFVRANKIAIQTTKPYFREIKNSTQHILILGDSTMYGAGIKNPSKTIGGLLAAKYEGASIETLASNGARVRTLPSQLSRARHDHYDLVVIGIGGNDIVRLSSYRRTKRELQSDLEAVVNLSDKVMLCHSVNIGNTGFFIFPLNRFFAYRSRKLSQLFQSVSDPFPQVRYVNFYRPMHDDYYNKQTRKKFIADDNFHPSDYANQYFFDLIWKAIQQ